MKVEICDATLYLGDCMDILPTLDKVDAVITDPPYGMKLDADFSKMNNKNGFKGKGIGNKYENVIGDDVDFDPTPFLLGKSQVFFGADYFFNKLPKNGSLSIWDKRTDASADKAFGSCFEVVWFYPSRKKDFLRHRWYGVFGTEREDVKQRVHPTQKPVDVMKWAIKNCKGNPEIILDPFMGSGTTGVAAIQMGRKFIGIEREKRYFDIACERIEAASKQVDMFIDKPNQQQEAMF